jgi:hemin uptake protein HemP
MPSSNEQPPAQKPATPVDPSAKIISAEQLFSGRREICIDHGGIRYRLRITRRNKLILQK